MHLHVQLELEGDDDDDCCRQCAQAPLLGQPAPPDGSHAHDGRGPVGPATIGATNAIVHETLHYQQAVSRCTQEAAKRLATTTNAVQYLRVRVLGNGLLEGQGSCTEVSFQGAAVAL